MCTCHTITEEVNDLISDVKTSKSTVPSSLPTKIMKQLNDIIASPLVELVNKSFQNGIFLDNFKVAKVIPIALKHYQISRKINA